jgi:hypothetical protein
VFLFPPSLRDWLPGDHPVWLVITRAVEQMDTGPFYGCHSLGGAGAPGYDRDMLVTVLAWAYAHQVTRSRRMEQLCHTDVAFRVICGGNLRRAPGLVGRRFLRLGRDPGRLRSVHLLSAGRGLYPAEMAGPGAATADASRRNCRRPRRRRGGSARSRRDEAPPPARYVLPGVPRPVRAPVLPLPGLTASAWTDFERPGPAADSHQISRPDLAVASPCSLASTGVAPTLALISRTGVSPTRRMNVPRGAAASTMPPGRSLAWMNWLTSPCGPRLTLMR